MSFIKDSPPPPPFIPIPTQDFFLAPDQIDIWEYPLSTLWPAAENLLNNEETTRANRYYFERHRRRFTIARSMLRLILSQYLPIPPEKLQFLTNDYGKPYLTQSAIEFNLSHSGDLALLAIGQTFPMGVDLEHFSSRPFQGMSEMMFAPLEVKQYTHMPSHMRTLSFFHIWAQKEAFIKACGMGLSYPTQTFTVPAYPVTDQLVEDRKHQCFWQMRSFMPQIACAAALCYHPQVQRLRYRKLSQDDHDLIR